jgi:hypothetical protein
MGNCIDGSWNLKARVERESGGEEGRESRDEGRGRTSALIVCNLDFEIRNMSALVSRNMSFAGSILFSLCFCCFCGCVGRWVDVLIKEGAH